jgi:hypothetical protein
MSQTVKTTSHYHDLRLGNQRKIFKTSIGTLIALVQLGTESTQGLCYTISTDGGNTWETPVQITTEVNSSKYYSGWLDSDNNLYVIYFRDTATKKTLFRKLTYSGTDTWSIGTEYTIWTDSFSFTYLHIRKTANGRLWAFTTRDTNNPWSKYSDNDGVTWTTSDYSGNVPVHLDVVIDNNDVYVYLTYSFSSGSKIQERIFTYSTGLWTNGTELYSSSTIPINRVAITRTSDGHRHLVYRQSTDKIYYREYTTSWQVAVLLTTFGTTDTGNVNDLTIGAYTDDIMVVWNEYESANQCEIKYKKRIVTTWDGSVTDLTNNNANNRCPVVPFYIDGSCYGIFLWYTGTSSPYDIKFENLAPPEIIKTDTLSLSDDININIPQENKKLSDSLFLSDDIVFTKTLSELESDSLSISDEIELNLSREKELLTDSLTVSDEILIAYSEANDLVNDFHLVRQVITDVNNKFNFVRQVLTNINNFCNTVYLRISDISQKINSKKQGVYDINNDIRTLLSFQIPGVAGVQSLGKSYIKVYINTIEQTDVDIDSIVITKSLDGAHTASFELGKAYDSTKPALESTVEIKYHIWTLYSGYISQIAPSDSPENIKIQCQDEYWKRNQNKVYFNVGHRPSSDNDLYYNTVSAGLSACGVSFGIGGFVPQVVGLFGTPQSDAISSLVNEAGNFSWYYNPGGIARLWQAGVGDIVNIERQEIGKNISLYQVLSHQIKEDAENLVNKFRVQMGQQVIKRFSSTGASQSYKSYETMNFPFNPSPNWDVAYEVLAKDSGSGYGWDYHPTSQDAFYAKVFKEYSMSNYIGGLAGEFEGWTDEFAPKVEVTSAGWEMNVPSGRMTSGFTIDYENNLLTFNEPIFCVQKNQYGEVTAIRRPNVYVCLYKKKYYTNTSDPSSNPQTDITNPLMFFTSVMGAYPITIMNNLNLTNLGIQVGGWYKDSETTWKLVPSWNDTGFAIDFANWQLSKGCDVKYSGNIELTLDAFCYYAIELNKRIMINGILDNPLNIESISLNVSSFTASISLKSGRYFARTASVQSRGE